MKWINTYLKREGLEDQVFLAAMLMAIPYFVSSIIFDLISLDNIVLLIIDVSFLLVCITMIFLSRKVHLRNILANIFCVLVIAGFLFFWVSSGGIDGGGAYVFPVVSVLVILISKGWHTIVFAVILGVVAVLVSSDWFEISGSADYQGLLFDFVLNLSILCGLLIFFKKSLDEERNELEKRNAEISKSNSELSIKTTELELYNRDIELIGKNLEKVAEKSFINMEKQNQKILEYSFINAHLVRAPLVNIIGLMSLIDDKNEQTESLEKTVQKFDGILHKISSVLKH